MGEDVEDGKRFTEELPVALTQAEMDKIGRKAGKLKREIRVIKAEMKEAVAGHKEKLKEKEAVVDAALEEFVLADDGAHDVELLQLFHRRYLRYKMLCGPEGSAMARHEPIQTFRS